VLDCIVFMLLFLRVVVLYYHSDGDEKGMFITVRFFFGDWSYNRRSSEPKLVMLIVHEPLPLQRAHFINLFPSL